MPVAVIVLAAGQGTRMNSDLPKVVDSSRAIIRGSAKSRLDAVTWYHEIRK